MIKINHKIINILMFIIIIYLFYQTRSFWFSVVSILKEILLPFFIAFIIAYALNPILEYLTNKKIPKTLSIILILISIISVFTFIIYLITPVFIEQINNIFGEIITFLKEVDLKYNIDFNDFQNTLSKTFNDILEKLGTYISSGAISIIGLSISIITKFFVTLASVIYFLNDMDKIKENIKKHFLKNNKKIYFYLSTINKELENYLKGFVKIIFITFFEYTIIYKIIGHPDYLMLGTLASIANLIPYFGGIITNIIAAITAFVISPELFIKTITLLIIFSAIDGYIINPLIYGKSNKIHPLIIIISIFSGGIIFGLIGIIFALPFAIILITTYRFLKKEKYVL